MRDTQSRVFIELSKKKLSSELSSALCVLFRLADAVEIGATASYQLFKVYFSFGFSYMYPIVSSIFTIYV